MAVTPLRAFRTDLPGYHTFLSLHPPAIFIPHDSVQLLGFGLLCSLTLIRDLIYGFCSSVVSLFPHPASFRFHLTMDTFAVGYILPTIGRIRDFHPLETYAARRTKEIPASNYLPVGIFSGTYSPIMMSCGFYGIAANE